MARSGYLSNEKALTANNSRTPWTLRVLRGTMMNWTREDLLWRDINDDDIQAVSSLLRADLSVAWVDLLPKFEADFALFAGGRYAVAFHNCTGAIYTALWAVGVRSGDHVLVCDYGFHGVAAAALALGACIVPVDCSSGSLTIDPDDLSRCKTSKTKAVIVHNPWGVPADYAAVRSAVRDLPIISDASHAHGASYGGYPLAHWSDITCYSMGPGKLISAGELGCAVTDDAELRDRMLSFGHVNRVPHDLIASKWVGNAVGLKQRPHPVAIVLASGQMKRYATKFALTRRTCELIEGGLSRSGLLPLTVCPGAERAYWRLVFRLSEDSLQDLAIEIVQEALKEAGIPILPNEYWPLLHDHTIFKWPEYTNRLHHRSCPIASRLVRRTIMLPAPVTLPPELCDHLITMTSAVLANLTSVKHQQPAVRQKVIG